MMYCITMSKSKGYWYELIVKKVRIERRFSRHLHAINGSFRTKYLFTNLRLVICIFKKTYPLCWDWVVSYVVPFCPQ